MDHSVHPIQDRKLSVGESNALACYGLIGKIDYNNGFLLAITKREFVGTIHNSAIYKIKDVVVIPLVRQLALTVIINEVAKHSNVDKGMRSESSESEYDDDYEGILDQGISDHEIDGYLDESEAVASNGGGTSLESIKSTNSIIEEVFLRQPPSKSWKRWFARKKGKSTNDDQNEQSELPPNHGNGNDNESTGNLDLLSESDIVPKVLTALKDLFSNKACYFSYDLDLTQSLCREPLFPPFQDIRNVYFYNRHISSVFSGTPLQLPIVQGYFEQVEFLVTDNSELVEVNKGKEEKQTTVTVTSGQLLDDQSLPGSTSSSDMDSIKEKVSKPTSSDFSSKTTTINTTATLYIISRRSTQRPGVRYMRRGIDSQGYCANWVETEQILTHPKSLSSFDQVRGSMPIYFTQSPYRLTPPPKVVKSEEENYKVLDKHFTQLLEYYQDVACVSLVEKPPSKEEKVGLLYSKLAARRGVYLEWFDFHRECKGMQFELVDKLFDTQIGAKMKQFGYYDKASNGSQTGILRTNCIDCLDRTNVVQSTCAKRILLEQLGLYNYKVTETNDFEMKFNSLWANNGDAISNQYSNTNALKGDFTRTRHRNYKGVLTDAFLTLSRFYYGVVSDFFTQAVIDYIQGVAGEDCFDLFEQEMQVSDPAFEIASLRENAIEITQCLVVASEKERVLGGWWLMTPVKPNTLRCVKVKDCIIIITNEAIYVCDFEIVSEKVTDYRRIPREAILGIQVGEYFGEILSKLSRLPEKNQGLIIQYNPQGTTKATSKCNDELGKGDDCVRNLALKMPLQHHVDLPELLTSLRTLCNDIQIEKRPIVSLDEALSDTRVWNTFEYQVKKAIWA